MQNAQAATTAAQEQQMWRCSADRLVAEAKAAAAAAATGTVTLISASVPAVNCGPSPSPGTTTTASVTPDSTGTLTGGSGPASPVSGDGTALATMLATSWGQTAADNATALGVNPAALAATCVLESNCQANPGGTGTISGAFQMSDGTFAQTVSEVSASNPALAGLITAKNDPASQSIAASQYLLDGAQNLRSAGIANPTTSGRTRLLPVWPGERGHPRGRRQQSTHGHGSHRPVVRDAGREQHHRRHHRGPMARQRHEQDRRRRLATCPVGEPDMRKSIIGLIAAGALVPSVRAEPVHAVRPIDGYVCMRLNVTEAEALNPRGTGIFILVAPRPDAARGTTAPGVVFAREPKHLVDGYLEVLQLTGQPGWIAADQVRPFDETRRCVPSMMSNGRIGIG